MSKNELFQKLYDQTSTGLRRFVQYRSRNPHMVDDILQEIYLEVFRHIDELALHENQVGWIYKTAEFKIKKLNELYDRNSARELADIGFEEPVTEDDVENIFRLDAYRGILKEDEFALVMKKYAEGYSYKEIGEMTGSTESGSKMKIMRLMQKLRKCVRNNVLMMVSLVIGFF